MSCSSSRGAPVPRPVPQAAPVQPEAGGSGEDSTGSGDDVGAAGDICLTLLLASIGQHTILKQGPYERMELLIVTLAYTTVSKDTDTLARIHLIRDTVRNAQGLLTSGFYRGRGTKPCYAMLTTWEDEESWRRAQERYSPKRLLIGSAAELLSAPPDQWQLSYLWGYSRPAASPLLAAMHMAAIRSEQADVVQRGWIEGLRRQVVHPTLAFAFLARGFHENALSTASSMPYTPRANASLRGTTFLNLLSWSSEAAREEFYADVNYQAVNRFVSSIGSVQRFPLEPM